MNSFLFVTHWPFQRVAVDIVANETLPGLIVTATAKLTGQTGVEMEALTAASIASLTIYDMAKAVDKGMIISDVRLLEKQGGKSGHWQARKQQTIGAHAMALLKVDDALEQLLADVTAAEVENVSLLHATGRVLAANLMANRDQPPFRAVSDGWLCNQG